MTIGRMTMLDKDRIRFHGKMMTVAMKRFQASCGSPEAEDFVERIFQEYKQAGMPKDVESWLADVLRPHFLSVSNAPRWVGSEPSWPFLKGVPMVFLHQFSLPENEVTRRPVTWDVEVYVFASRVPEENGYRRHYEVVEQDAGIDGGE